MIHSFVGIAPLYVSFSLQRKVRWILTKEGVYKEYIQVYDTDLSVSLNNFGDRHVNICWDLFWYLACSILSSFSVCYLCFTVISGETSEITPGDMSSPPPRHLISYNRQTPDWRKELESVHWLITCIQGQISFIGWDLSCNVIKLRNWKNGRSARINLPCRHSQGIKYYQVGGVQCSAGFCLSFLIIT